MRNAYFSALETEFKVSIFLKVPNLIIKLYVCPKKKNHIFVQKMVISQRDDDELIASKMEISGIHIYSSGALQLSPY